jgi:hypothetical protein
MSRGADAVAKTKSPRNVEIIVTPKPGVQEKPYQCQNRIGTFESLANLFAAGFSKIEETSCFHKGAECCHYHISWNDPPAMLQKRIRNYTMILGILSSIILFSILPITLWIIFLLSSVSFCSLLAYRSELLEKKDLAKTIEVQGNAAKELVEEIDIRHNHALLVQKIGQITSTLMDIDQLTTSVLDIVKTYLDFDRGLILLANADSSRLVYHASYQSDFEAFFFKPCLGFLKRQSD